MTVHIGEVTTDVTAEGGTPPAAQSAPAPSTDGEQLRLSRERAERDRRRTCAEGFDD